MKKLLTILLFLSICLCVSGAWGATYYVDCNADGDDGAGTGTGAAVAWKTINKVNDSSFSGDDQILFNRGCTWREQLTVPSSGTSGHPITFGAYGSGEKPIISGATVTATWTTLYGPNEGPDLMTNGTFASSTGWTLGAGWTIGSGVLTSASASFPQATHTALTEDFINGNTYKITYTVSGSAGGGAFLVLANHDVANGNVSLDTSNGIHTATWVSGKISGGVDDVQIVSNNWVGSLDNIVIKEQLAGDGPATGVYSKGSITTEPKTVFYTPASGVTRLLTPHPGVTTAVSTNEFDWDSNTLYINVGEDPADGTVEIGQRDYGIIAISKSSYTIQDIDLVGANSVGLADLLGTGSSIARVGCSYNLNGCQISTETVSISSSIFHHNASNGFQATDAGVATLNGCQSYNNLQDGFNETGDSSSVTCSRCLAYNNGSLDSITGMAGAGDGYTAHDASTLNLYYSIGYENWKSGVATVGSAGGTIENCVFYNNKNAGLPSNGYGIAHEATAGTPAWTWKNNIVFDNNIETVVSHSGTSITLTSDYNCFYHTAGGTPYKFEGTAYSFADWKTQTSGDANSIEAAPLFVSATDFHLQPGSPAIDAGTDVGLTSDYEGRPVPNGSAPDIGAYEYYGGSGPGHMGTGMQMNWLRLDKILNQQEG